MNSENSESIAARDTAENRHEAVWTGILAGVSVVGSWAFVCMMPFAAIGTLLAATLPLRKAMMWVGALWLYNQLVGYLILDYPRTVSSFALGGALLLAGLASLLIAHVILRLRQSAKLLDLGLALLAAFAVFELVLYAAALFFGGTHNFTLEIIWLIGRNDLIWFAGFMILRFALVRGLPNYVGSTVARHPA